MPLYPQNLVALGSRRFKPGSPSLACTCSDVVRTPHTERKRERERVTSRCCSSPVCGGVSPGNGREGEAAVNHQDFSFITDVFHSLHCLFLFSAAHLASFSFLSGPCSPGLDKHGQQFHRNLFPLGLVRVSRRDNAPVPGRHLAAFPVKPGGQKVENSLQF